MTTLMEAPPEPGPDTAPAASRSPRPDVARYGRHPLVRVPTLALGGLIALALLAGTTYVVANLLVRTNESDTTTLEGDVRRVDIKVTGQVVITAGAVDGARIDRRSTFGVERPRIVQTLEDGLLTVRVQCPGGISVVCSNRVEVEVPADVSLLVDAMGVQVSDVTGDIEVTSGAGSVELDGVSGTVGVNVGGGSIVGRDLRSARVRATAGAGSVDLGFTTAPEDVEATSGAGSVVVDLPPGDETYRVDANAGAGDSVIAVATDPAGDRVIRASAGAGSVEVRYSV